MLNFQASKLLAAQHRQELLREAKREQLAGQVAPGTPGFAHHGLRDLGRQMLRLVRHGKAGDAATLPRVLVGAPIAHHE